MLLYYILSDLTKKKILSPIYRMSPTIPLIQLPIHFHQFSKYFFKKKIVDYLYYHCTHYYLITELKNS